MLGSGGRKQLRTTARAKGPEAGEKMVSQEIFCIILMLQLSMTKLIVHGPVGNFIQLKVNGERKTVF